jgi:hypothetical protein
MSQLTLQLPDPVMDAVKKLADRERITLEEFIACMVSETVRLDEFWEQRVARGKKVSRERFLEILNNAPDVPPIPGDEIES